MILVLNALDVVLVARQKTLTVGYVQNVFNCLVLSRQLKGDLRCQNSIQQTVWILRIVNLQKDDLARKRYAKVKSSLYSLLILRVCCNRKFEHRTHAPFR